MSMEMNFATTLFLTLSVFLAWFFVWLVISAFKESE